MKPIRREKALRKKEEAFVLSGMETVSLPVYNSLTDRNLRTHFEKTKVRRVLEEACLIDNSGRILDPEKNKGKLFIIDQEFEAAEREELWRQRADEYDRKKLEARKADTLANIARTGRYERRLAPQDVTDAPKPTFKLRPKKLEKKETNGKKGKTEGKKEETEKKEGEMSASYNLSASFVSDTDRKASDSEQDSSPTERKKSLDSTGSKASKSSRASRSSRSSNKKRMVDDKSRSASRSGSNASRKSASSSGSESSKASKSSKASNSSKSSAESNSTKASSDS